MADPSKISGDGFLDKVWDTVNGLTMMAGAFSGQNIRITLAEIAKFVLGNRSFLAGTTGNIVTTDGTQDISGIKKFADLRVNTNVKVTATSQELNHCVGVTAPIQGQFTAIQNRTTTLEADVAALELQNNVIVWSLAFVPGGQTYNIPAGLINNVDDINAYSILYKLYRVYLTNLLTEETTIGSQIYQTGGVLDSITVPIAYQGSQYKIVISYKKASKVLVNG